MPQPYKHLKGITEIGNYTYSEQLEKNLVEYLNWGLLNIGSFWNVEIGQSGHYGGDLSRLRPVQDPRYANGKIWEGSRQNWIWESGLDYGTQPNVVSGIYVDSVFYPTATTTGTYAHRIHYPFGQVIFNNPISTGSIVQCKHSFKYIGVYDSDANWFREIMYNSFRVDNPSFLTGSGMWSVLAQNRVQLPAIVVKITSDRTFKGAELGGAMNMHLGTEFHIFAETPSDEKKLTDILCGLTEKSIHAINFNYIRTNNLYPLLPNGSLASGAKTYSNLIDSGDARWQDIIFDKFTGQDIDSMIPTHRAIVHGKCIVRYPDID